MQVFVDHVQWTLMAEIHLPVSTRLTPTPANQPRSTLCLICMWWRTWYLWVNIGSESETQSVLSMTRNIVHLHTCNSINTNESIDTGGILKLTGLFVFVGHEQLLRPVQVHWALPEEEGWIRWRGGAVPAVRAGQTETGTISLFVAGEFCCCGRVCD